MVLDGESLALAPRAAELIAAAEGADLPGTLKSELFASALELNTGVCETAAEGAEALAALRRSGVAPRGGARPAACGGREPSLQPTRGAGDRGRAALRGVRRVRGRLGPAAGSERAPRPHRHAERGGVLPRSRGSAALAARRARLVGELAVLRRGGDGTRLEPGARCSRSFRATARRRPFAPTRTGRSSRNASSASAWPTTTRGSGGTSGRIRASAPSRSGCPTSRPSSTRTVGFVALLKGLCDAVLERPQRPYDPAGRGFYQQNRWAASRFGLAAELVHPDGDRTAPASELATELAALAGEDGLDPTRMEADRQLEVGRAEGLRGRLRGPRRAHAKLGSCPFRRRPCR